MEVGAVWEQDHYCTVEDNEEAQRLYGLIDSHRFALSSLSLKTQF